MILLREKVGHRPGLTSSPRQYGAGCCLFQPCFAWRASYEGNSARLLDCSLCSVAEHGGLAPGASPVRLSSPFLSGPPDLHGAQLEPARIEGRAPNRAPSQVSGQASGQARCGRGDVRRLAFHD